MDYEINIILAIAGVGIGALMFLWLMMRIKNMFVSILIGMVGLATFCAGLVGIVLYIGRLLNLLH